MKKITTSPIVAGIGILLATTCLSITATGCKDSNTTGEKTTTTVTTTNGTDPASGKTEAAPKEELGVTNVDQEKLSAESYPMLAANMLDRIIHDKDISKHLQILKETNAETLSKALNTDELRKSFWINIYNAYTQYFLKKDATLYESDRSKFFDKEQIEIAGYKMAMNDIEHGILRRGATIWSKGNVRLPWRNDLVRQFKVDKVDYHIHFALNCGAESCPPVSVYLPEKTTQELDAAANYYLNRESKYDAKSKTVEVPALLEWFSDDFTSGQSKHDILKKYKVIPEDADPKIIYKDYNWTMKVRNYKQY